MKIPKQVDTLEFKQLAIEQVKTRHSALRDHDDVLDDRYG